MKIRQKPAEEVWESFEEQVKPTPEQLEQFQKYANYLLECNKLFNLTAITELSGVVRNHFIDSLSLGKFMDMSKISMIADIGSGAGFPGIPLKIIYPHLKVVLIEVTRKKQEFLADVVNLLGLDDVEIYCLDWRTFLRTTDYPVDCFVTRAALEDVELIRMFKPACPYNKATLAYWASKHWEPSPKAKPLVDHIEHYRLGAKDRCLVFMALHKAAE